MNVSRATTKTEVMYAENIDRWTLRMQGLNLSGGMTNSVEFCVRVLGMPDTQTLLDAFQADLDQNLVHGQIKTDIPSSIEIPLWLRNYQVRQAA